MTTRVDGPADKLVGLTLLEEWEVTDRIRRNTVRSGEPRTSCYRAENSKGDQAFVKAFDFWYEDVAGDPMSLERMVREFNHEHNVHQMCKDKRLARVTRIYNAGKVLVDGYAVHFLICEYAPQSLGRHFLPEMSLYLLGRALMRYVESLLESSSYTAPISHIKTSSLAMPLPTAAATSRLRILVAAHAGPFRRPRTMTSFFAASPTTHPTSCSTTMWVVGCNVGSAATCS